MLILSFGITNISAQESNEIQKLEEIRGQLTELTEEIKETNANSETLFWTSIIIGEIIAGIAIIATIAYTRQLYEQTNQLKRQIENTSETDSANLTFEVSRRIFADFSKTVDLIWKADEGQQVQFNLESLEKLIGELELVSVFVHKKVIKIIYAYEMFSKLIAAMEANEQIHDFIELKRQQDIELFSGFRWLADQFRQIHEERNRIEN